MPNDTEHSRTDSCQPQPSRQVFRNAGDFLEEWRAAAQSLSPSRQTVLESVVIQGIRQVVTAAEMGITRERVRQLLETSLHAMRHAAKANPRGELAHTRDSLTDIAETVGITTWRFHRMRDATRQSVIQQVTNIGAITPEQGHLMHAACSLTDKPTTAWPDLQPVERSLRRILNLHPDGITPADAARLMENERTILDSWPRLDLAKFAAARLWAEWTTEGLLQKPVPTRGPSTRQTTVSLMAQALQNAGDCLHTDDIAAAVRALATERGLDIEPSTSACARIAQEERWFRWVTQSTYGLAEWGVGHSNPEAKTGRRTGVRDEILFLLDQHQTIALSDLMEHINERFRRPESSVRPW